MTRLDIFRHAWTKANDLQKKHPEDGAVEQVAIQLLYLIQLEDGERKDRRHLENINIGILAVREIEPLDMTLAELIYRAVEEVELMKNERPPRDKE